MICDELAAFSIGVDACQAMKQLIKIGLSETGDMASNMF